MQRCDCPVYCLFCGAKLKRDLIGHLCPTHNCQWQHGIPGCSPEERRERSGKQKAAAKEGL